MYVFVRVCAHLSTCNCTFIGATIYINIIVARPHQVDL